jgi:hypothetical protein
MKNLILLACMIFTVNLFGQCIEGDCKNGEGTILYKSGNKYKGEFANGKRHGYGRFIWTSGARYKGEWKNNKKDGQGIELLADGSRYEGQFENHKKSGEGKYYDANGKVINDGIWENGVYAEQSKTTKTAKSNSNLMKSNRFLNLGVGLGSTYANTSFLPLSISFDFKELENGVTLGLYGGYVGQKVTAGNILGSDYGYKYRHFVLGLRGTYPIDMLSSDKTTTYVGGMLGYNIVSSSYFGDSLFNTSTASSSSFFYSGFAGVRQAINKSIYGFAEIGYGISYLTCGVSKKF